MSEKEKQAARRAKPAGAKKAKKPAGTRAAARSSWAATAGKTAGTGSKKTAAASGKKPARAGAKRPAAKAKKRRARSANSAASWLLTAALLAGILLVGAWGVLQLRNYRTYQAMRVAVENTTFYEGTYVDGVDVSGMTLDDALTSWKNNIEDPNANRTVTLNNGATFTAAEMGYTSDYELVLRNAWSAGRNGSLKSRYAGLQSKVQRPASYTVTRVDYDPERVEACVSAIAEAIDRPAEDAHVADFDLSSFSYTFTDEVTGSEVQQDVLYNDICSALEAGGGTVELPVLAILPAVTKGQIEGQYGMITSAVTDASSSKENRLANIKQAMAYIHGTCLHPGDVFSFNQTVGERTKERGFKVATAYSGGTVTEDLGGGICQVSTTLFNAAVKADLQIVERHNHSLVVHYVDKGKDATVNWDTQDLKFKNTSDDDIYIVCGMTKDKRVRIGIFGKLLPNGETITVEAVTTSRIDFETEYQYNPAYPSGAFQVTQEGKKGYTAEAYKVRWDAKGHTISRELLCKSTYRPTKQIVQYGA